MTLGKGGGLQEVMYASAGFLLVRRAVYMDIQRQLHLPVCDEPSGAAAIPFFLTSAVPHNDGYRLLSDDDAFCERARQCGHRVFVDTSISLPCASE